MPVEVGTEQVEGKSKRVLVEALKLLVVETGRVGVLMVEVKEAVVEVMLAKLKVRVGVVMAMVEANEVESLQVAKLKVEVETGHMVEVKLVKLRAEIVSMEAMKIELGEVLKRVVLMVQVSVLASGLTVWVAPMLELTVLMAQELERMV